MTGTALILIFFTVECQFYFPFICGCRCEKMYHLSALAEEDRDVSTRCLVQIRVFQTVAHIAHISVFLTVHSCAR